MISIIFSSYNGALTLPLMLDSLAEITEPNCGWEIIAVDNNSSDSTLSILKSYQKKLPLKIVQQVIPGKNAALNLGLTYALGDLFIFTDDDVIPAPDWLLQYEKVLSTCPEYVLFGGHIAPYWMETPSAKLLQHIPLGVAFALTDEQSLGTGPIKAGKIWGPNMAVRSLVFKNGISFNESIGPNGTNYVMGSETDFLQRAEQAGHRAYFFSEAKVKHIIRPWQLSHSWLESRAFKSGRAQFHNFVRNNSQQKVTEFLGYPRWVLVDYLKSLVNYKLAALGIGKAQEYKMLWDCFFKKGYASEYKKKGDELV
jgi:glycosyltransferase involved in cell wall biosynthesis